MSQTDQAITVELLTEGEAELAFQIEHTVQRISTCRADTWVMAPTYGLLAVVIGGALDYTGRLPFQLFRRLFRAVGDDAVIWAVLGLAAAVVLVTGVLAQLLYANRKIRRLGVALGRLAADSRTPRLLEKLASYEFLALRTASYRQTVQRITAPHPANMRYLHRYFPQLMH